MASVAALALSACTTWTPVYKDVTPLVGPVPYLNRTPMHGALVCLQGSTRANQDVRLGVADFIDGSGASMGDTDVNGRYFSQRPDLMLIVALSKTGVRLVNRTSTAVAEWEMRQAMDRRLGEGKPVVVGQTRFDYRPVRAGDLLGSTYYLNGAITEINWSLSSNVEEAGFLGATAGRRTYRVSMAVDLVVTNSLTTEVVFARSYSKQLVGYETGAGVFRFVEATIMPKSRVELFQANIGQKQNEPVQQALRWLVELAGYEVVASLTGGDDRCDALVPGREPGDSDDDSQGLEPVPTLRAQRRPSIGVAPVDAASSQARPRRLYEQGLEPRSSVAGARDARDGHPDRERSASRTEVARRDPAAAAQQALPRAGARASGGPPVEATPRPLRDTAEPAQVPGQGTSRTAAPPQRPAVPAQRPWSAERQDYEEDVAPPAASPVRARQEPPWFRPATTRTSGRAPRQGVVDFGMTLEGALASRVIDE